MKPVPDLLSVVDAHTHVQPDAAAARSFLARLGLGAEGPGDLDAMLAAGERAGVVRHLVVPWLPAQLLVRRAVAAGADRDHAVGDVLDEWDRLNHWAAAVSRCHGARLRCLVGLDPVLMSGAQVRTAVERGLAGGAVGLKIAPQWLGVRPDDPAVEIVWQLAREFGVPVLSESGPHRFGDALPWGHPRYFEAVCRSYPDVTIVLAHLGSGAEPDLARLTSTYPNVHADTALRLPDAADDAALRALAETIRRVGVERVLFGTNFPLADPHACVRALRALPLGEAERRAVAHDNAMRVWAAGPRAAPPNTRTKGPR